MSLTESISISVRFSGFSERIGRQFTRQFKTSPDVFRKELAEFMEGRTVRAVVIPFIHLDLLSTVINGGLENTDWLNPKYAEQGEYISKLTHNVSVAVLGLFLAEQLLRMFAFGRRFFTCFWMVSDFVVVIVSLISEVVLEDLLYGLAGAVIALRLWKLIGFVYDSLLLNHEINENLESSAHDGGVTSDKAQRSCCRCCSSSSLAEFMEGRIVRAIVIPLIGLDLVSTAINFSLENTDMLDPKYIEQGENMARLTHIISVAVLSIFLVEQLLRILAFRCRFFTCFWMVSDFVVVVVSFISETFLEGSSSALGFLCALRLWKLVGFVYDSLLLNHEISETPEHSAHSPAPLNRQDGRALEEALLRPTNEMRN